MRGRSCFGPFLFFLAVPPCFRSADYLPHLDNFAYVMSPSIHSLTPCAGSCAMMLDDAPENGVEISYIYIESN